MTPAFASWLEHFFESKSATQRAQVEAAKLVATLAVATAAAFVASSLQSGHSRTENLVAAYLIGGSLLSVVAAILLDRSTIIDWNELAVGSATAQFDDEEGEEKELLRLRRLEMVNVLNNDAVVRQVKVATGFVLLLSFASAAFSIGSLLS